MVAKSIKLDDDAYERLTYARATPRETWSSVIRRVLPAKRKPTTAADILAQFEKMSGANYRGPDEKTLDGLERRLHERRTGNIGLPTTGKDLLAYARDIMSGREPGVPESVLRRLARHQKERRISLSEWDAHVS